MDEDTGENKPLNKLVIGTFDNRGTFRVDLGEIDNKIVKVVQSIKTLGAAGFESFRINGETYLAVANFWDGKSKDMEAKSIIYHVTPIIYINILAMMMMDFFVMKISKSYNNTHCLPFEYFIVAPCLLRLQNI